MGRVPPVPRGTTSIACSDKTSNLFTLVLADRPSRKTLADGRLGVSRPGLSNHPHAIRHGEFHIVLLTFLGRSKKKGERERERSKQVLTSPHILP